MSNSSAEGSGIAGAACYGALVSGAIALLMGIAAVFFEQWAACGICLGAAGLSFGLLANAALRD